MAQKLTSEEIRLVHKRLMEYPPGLRVKADYTPDSVEKAELDHVMQQAETILGALGVVL